MRPEFFNERSGKEKKSSNTISINNKNIIIHPFQSSYFIQKIKKTGSERVPAQDLMVQTLRSKMRTLAKCVISPTNLNIFIFDLQYFVVAKSWCWADLA